MAKSVTKVIRYGRVKTPKGKTKLIKTGKEVVKATNVSKGANTGGKPWGSDKAALASERITENARTRRAEIAARSVDIANITSGLNQATKTVAGAFTPSTKQDPGVQQAVQGGIQQGGSTRDDEDDDDDSSAYVI